MPGECEDNCSAAIAAFIFSTLKFYIIIMHNHPRPYEFLTCWFVEILKKSSKWHGWQKCINF